VAQAPILGTILHHELSPDPHIKKVSTKVAIRLAKLRAQGSVHGLMSFAASVFLLKMHAKGIICSDLPTWGWGDVSRLDQLMHMYLAKAAGIKMTDGPQYTRLRAEAALQSVADMFHGAVLLRARRIAQHEEESLQHQLFAVKSPRPRKNVHKLLQHRVVDAIEHFDLEDDDVYGEDGLLAMTKGRAKKMVKAWAAEARSLLLETETASSELGTLFWVLWGEDDPSTCAAIHDANDPLTAVINNIRINGAGLNRYSCKHKGNPEHQLCASCEDRAEETVEHLLECAAYQDLFREFVANQDDDFRRIWPEADNTEKLRIMCCLETADDERSLQQRWYTMIGAALFFQGALARRDVMREICGPTAAEATRFRAQHGEQNTLVKEILSGSG